MSDMKSLHFPPPVADDMVRAILDDCKTVTRRVMKPQPKDVYAILPGGRGNFDFECAPNGILGHAYAETINPPYRFGDILYVRETWRVRNVYGDFVREGRTAEVEFRAGGDLSYMRIYEDSVYSRAWHPSIHMPREAARIFLRVTDVKLQQLKNITDADALLEGFYSRASLVAELLKIYPDLEEDSWIWVIAFERISREEAMRNV